MGIFLHGLFDEAGAMAALLSWAALADEQAFDYAAQKAASLLRLGDSVQDHLDTNALRHLLKLV